MEARGGLGTRRADALVRMPSLRPPGGLRWGRPSRPELFKRVHFSGGPDL